MTKLCHFLALPIFDNLFLQALILLDEKLVQTDIKLAANGDEIANIRVSFPLSRAMAERNLSLSLRPPGELILLTG